jgi:hypothetical protein
MNGSVGEGRKCTTRTVVAPGDGRAWHHRPMLRWFPVLVAACLLGGFRLAAAGDEQWYSVHLDGRKIGHLHALRTELPDRVRSERRLQLVLERNGQPLRVRSEETVDETPDGEPLGFSTLTDLAGSISERSAELRDGELLVRTDAATPAQRSAWPPGALLTEGQRLRFEREPLAAGHRFELLAYDPAAQRAQRVEWLIGETQPVDIHGRTEVLRSARQRVDPGDSELEVAVWLEPADRSIRRLRLPALGLQLEMLACDRACALAPDQPTDVLAAVLVAAPRPLGAGERRGLLEYQLRLGADLPHAIGELPGQTLLDRGEGRLQLSVDPRGDDRRPPDPEDLAATRWLESDAAGIREMAQRAIGNRRGAEGRMRALERAVRHHITVKSLRVGYASALETLHAREGDCTEHAVLLAALARAVGIPARVATGLAYAERFEEHRDVFVPHAWVLAWVDGRWQGFDAALPGHGSGHIALAVDHGDPFRFYRGLELLGRLSIDSVLAAAGPGATVTRR